VTVSSVGESILPFGGEGCGYEESNENEDRFFMRGMHSERG
jgi:hypothetical protein